MAPEERQAQIVEAAAKLFAEKGFDGTSIDDIAEACGVAPGLIYHYFDSKTDILKALMEREAFLTRMAEILKTPPKGTVEETLTELAWAMWEMLEEKRDFVLMMHGEMQRNPEVAKVIGETIRTSDRLLSEYLNAQKSEGELRGDLDTEIFVRTFWGALFEFFFAHHKLSPFVRRISPKKLVQGIVRLLLYGAINPNRNQTKGESER